MAKLIEQLERDKELYVRNESDLLLVMTQMKKDSRSVRIDFDLPEGTWYCRLSLLDI